MQGRHPEGDRAPDEGDAKLPATLVPIGVVIGAHGLRGELRLRLHNPSSTLLRTRAMLWLREAGRPPSIVHIVQAREQGRGLWCVALENCRDRDAATKLRGAELCVGRSELPRLPEGEHYLLEFAGLEARNAAGHAIGRVLEAIEYPAAHVLRVATERGELEIPLAEPYVLDARPEDGYVIVGELDDLEPIAAQKPRRN